MQDVEAGERGAPGSYGSQASVPHVCEFETESCKSWTARPDGLRASIGHAKALVDAEVGKRGTAGSNRGQVSVCQKTALIEVESGEVRAIGAYDRDAHMVGLREYVD